MVVAVSGSTLSPTDQCLLLLGRPGRFQWLVLFLLAVLQSQCALNLLSAAQLARPVRHRCRARPNATVGGSDLWPVVLDEGDRRYHPCLLYRDPTNRRAGTQPCPDGYEYLAVDKTESVVSEWDLVCDRSWLADLVRLYLRPASSALGALIFCACADRVASGRRTTLFVAQALQVSSAVALLFVPCFLAFALIYALQTACSMGSQLVSFVIMLELLPTPFHVQGACVLAVASTVGHVLMAALSSLVASWRYVQLALAAPQLVSLAFLWLVPYSLPHLLLRGQLATADVTLRRMAQLGRVGLPPGSVKLLLQYAAASRSLVAGASRGSALSQVFVYKQIRRYLLTHLYLWAVVSLFLAIRVSEISTLTGNRSADLFTRGFLAVGVLLLVFVLAGRMGTVRIQTLLLALGGSLFVVAAFFEHRRVASNEKGLTLDLFYSGLCALFGWTAVVVTKSTMLFDMAKSMPTGTRAFCLGLCVAVGSLAEILAPTVSTLGGLLPFYLPMAGCGVLVLTAAGLSLVFPDAWKRPLPASAEAADDAKKPSRRRRRGSYSPPASRLGTATASALPLADDGTAALTAAKIHRPKQASIRSTRTTSETSCKRPLDSMESSSTPRSTFAAQMVYPEKGSVYFQSCRAGRNISPSKTTTRANSASSAEDNESDDGESRLTDLEDELNRAWEMGALSLRSPQQRTPHQRQQHVMQCFGVTRKNSSEGNFINETAF
ncbi:organic cation transporter protein-like [Rhipicephalus microplus]|uniref:organic cation transporter protein-like n=1 Tax=Rhipicephalus microplus TaxID=6941 RepID=UPI003F6BFD48